MRVSYLQQVFKKQKTRPLQRKDRYKNLNLWRHLNCSPKKYCYENANTFSAFNAGLRSEYSAEKAFHLSLNGPFAVQLFAGLSATPALCGCSLRFDFRFIGLNNIIVSSNYIYFFMFVNTLFQDKVKKFLTHISLKNMLQKHRKYQRYCYNRKSV